MLHANRLVALGLALGVSIVVSGHGRPAQAQVKKTEILAAIDAALKTWETVPCANIKFEFKGLLTTFQQVKDDAVLIYWGVDKHDWIHGSQGYRNEVAMKQEETGFIKYAFMGFNARDFYWSFEAEKGKIDIQSAVLNASATALGFYVGENIQLGSLNTFITYDKLSRTLLPLHLTGAQFSYFKPGAGCTRPAPPISCKYVPGPSDAGAGKDVALIPDARTVDASGSDGPPPPELKLCVRYSIEPYTKPYIWEKQPIPYYVYLPDVGKLPGSLVVNPNQDASLTDGIKPPQYDSGSGTGGKDDGCCRVSHARGENLSSTVLLGCGLLLFAALMRRRDSKSKDKDQRG